MFEVIFLLFFFFIFCQKLIVYSFSCLIKDLAFNPFSCMFWTQTDHFGDKELTIKRKIEIIQVVSQTKYACLDTHSGVPLSYFLYILVFIMSYLYSFCCLYQITQEYVLRLYCISLVEKKIFDVNEAIIYAHLMPFLAVKNPFFSQYPL